MTSYIVLLDRSKKFQKVIAKFASVSDVTSYCEQYIKGYINERQGDQEFKYSNENLPLKYGFFVKCSTSHIYKWSVKEVQRTVGLMYNSYETVKHFTISVAENYENPKYLIADITQDIAFDDYPLYDEVINEIRARRKSISDSLSSSSSDSSESC